METYKTVVGTKNLNDYIKAGWKRIHVFTKPLAWGEDGNIITECDAAFVIVWECLGEPVDPHKKRDLPPPE
jgi:hypothetical protein